MWVTVAWCGSPCARQGVRSSAPLRPRKPRSTRLGLAPGGCPRVWMRWRAYTVHSTTRTVNSAQRPRRRATARARPHGRAPRAPLLVFLTLERRAPPPLWRACVQLLVLQAAATERSALSAPRSGEHVKSKRTRHVCGNVKPRTVRGAGGRAAAPF